MKISKLDPFGLEVQSNRPLSELEADNVNEWIDKHRAIVMRGLPTPTDDEILEFCGRLGHVLEWEFGAFNELKVDPEAKNYLYTNRKVPMHWDGAFVGKIPHLIFFICQQGSEDASTAGGETVFCDAIQLVATLSDDERKQMESLEIAYSTDKVVHYGGSFTSPLIAPHPTSGEPALRYAEPVMDLNPVRLKVSGLSDQQQAAFVSRMEQKLYDPCRVYSHAWRTGDILIADNHALLHGRNALLHLERRHLRRVNIL